MPEKPHFVNPPFVGNRPESIAQMSDRRSKSHSNVALAGGLVVIAVLAALDVVTDLAEGTSLRHVLVEAAVLVVAGFGAAIVLRELVASRRETRRLKRDSAELAGRLAATRQEAARWRGETEHLLRGLGVAIDDQFDRWNLTRAEREVGLLLLKGLSHHEVAKVRGVAESTVRQQAQSIYEKGGLDGRHELSAFFLEDLLLPDEEQQHGEA